MNNYLKGFDMWATSEGMRTLQGAEKNLFLFGVEYIVDEYIFGARSISTAIKEIGKHDPNKHYDPLNRSFPALRSQDVKEKIIALAAVTSALLDDSLPAPNHTAWNESIIACVYSALKDAVTVEVELEWRHKTFRIRNAIALACEECALESPRFSNDSNLELWHECIDISMDRILWDCDYEIEFVSGIPSDLDDLIEDPREYFCDQLPQFTPLKLRDSLRYLLSLFQIID